MRRSAPRIQEFQTKEGTGWVRAFAAYYLGFKRTCSLEDACTLPVLSSEVERAGDTARASYEQQMKQIFELMAKHLPDDAASSSTEKAYALMALLAGGALLARTVLDPELSAQIAAAVEAHALRLTESAS